MSAQAQTVVNACYNKETGIARVSTASSTCLLTEQPVSWNVQSPTVPQSAAVPGPSGQSGVHQPSVSYKQPPSGSSAAFNTGDGISGNGSSGIALEAKTAIDPATDVTASVGHLPVLAAGGVAGTNGAAVPAEPSGLASSTGPVRPGVTAATTIPKNLTALSGALSTNGGVAYLGATSFRYSTNLCQIGDVVLSVNGYGTGALPADGRLLPINQYTPAFSILGTNFGGNGTTNFALPDLRPFAPKGLQYSICVMGIFPSRN
jgi:hypothetical protein